MMMGNKLRSSLAKAPTPRPSMQVANPNFPTQAVTGAIQGAQGAGLQRLSPGVYRNQQGQLVGNHGQSLPGQHIQRPPMQVPQPQQQQPGMHNLPYNFQPYNPVQNYIPGSQQPAWRPLAPLQPQQPGMMYAGGTPNFNEMTGQYNPQLLAATQAANAGMQYMQGYGNQQTPFPPPQGAPTQSLEQIRAWQSQHNI